MWGPRKTSKTTLLRALFPRALVYDLLDTDLFFELSRRPASFREQVLAQPEAALRGPVIVDEIQKVPQLLDEIHWLIENQALRFILSGSSARKLRRGRANLLGGRAWRYQLFPLVWAELENMDLLKVLNRGLIPSHYLQDGYRRSLKAYVQDYLKEEVFDEGLTRNVPAFSRFS
ncbi:MAG: AAA family ATPase [Candidatus Binatia bacterium]